MITDEMFDVIYEAYLTKPDARDSVKAALAASYPLIRQQVMDELGGIESDLDYLVDAFYRACPDNYFLNANYPREGSKEIVDRWVSDRDKVLEEAAKVCDEYAPIHPMYTGKELAQAIRDMKEKQS